MINGSDLSLAHNTTKLYLGSGRGLKIGWMDGFPVIHCVTAAAAAADWTGNLQGSFIIERELNIESIMRVTF